jgi:citrate lyase subunit beta/citryl-CoA lyase
VLIETHGALREVWEIAALPGVESLDFGLMDFVSGHHGAIPGSAMKSPGQFEHPLVARAKCEITAAALANGVVPSHNVTTELKDHRDDRNDARAPGRVRLPAHVEHPPQPDPAHRRSHAPGLFRGRKAAAEILIAAQDKDWGPIQHEGRLHDRASYRYYWELLERAHVTGMEIGTAAKSRFFA